MTRDAGVSVRLSNSFTPFSSSLTSPSAAACRSMSASTKAKEPANAAAGSTAGAGGAPGQAKPPPPAAKLVQKREIDVDSAMRNVMIQNGVKDQTIDVEHNGTRWSLLLRKKMVKPVGGAWNQLMYIDVYHMENETHFGS